MTNFQFYILDTDGRTPKLVGRDEYLAWINPLFHDPARLIETIRVGHDVFPDGARLSTAFLQGCLHFPDVPFGNTPPFETAYFDSEGSIVVVDRYQTWADALDGHLGVLAGVMHGREHQQNPDLVCKQPYCPLYKS